jgi:hypothetical protein
MTCWHLFLNFYCSSESSSSWISEVSENPGSSAEPVETDLVEIIHNIVRAPTKYQVTFSTISVVFLAPKGVD